MKSEQDYGYFGKGTKGYIHYTQTHKQCYPNTDANIFSFRLLGKLFLILFFGYYALAFGKLALEAFCMIHIRGFEAVLVSLISLAMSALFFWFANIIRKL